MDVQKQTQHTLPQSGTSEIEGLFDARPKDKIQVFQENPNRSVGTSLGKIINKIKENFYSARDYLLNKFFSTSEKNYALRNIKQTIDTSNMESFSQIIAGDAKSRIDGEIILTPEKYLLNKPPEENTEEVKISSQDGYINFMVWYQEYKTREPRSEPFIMDKVAEAALDHARGLVAKNLTNSSNVSDPQFKDMLDAAKALLAAAADKTDRRLDELSAELPEIFDEIMISVTNSEKFISSFGRKITSAYEQEKMALALDSGSDFMMELFMPGQKNPSENEEYAQLKSDTRVFFLWCQLWSDVITAKSEEGFNFEKNSQGLRQPMDSDKHKTQKLIVIKARKDFEENEFSKKYSASEMELLACNRFIEKYKIIMQFGSEQQKEDCKAYELEKYVEDYTQFYRLSKKIVSYDKNLLGSEVESNVPDKRLDIQVSANKPLVKSVDEFVDVTPPVVNGIVTLPARKTPSLPFPKLTAKDLSKLEDLLNRDKVFKNFKNILTTSQTYFLLLAENDHEPDEGLQKQAMDLALAWQFQERSPQNQDKLKEVPHYENLKAWLSLEKIQNNFR